MSAPEIGYEFVDDEVVEPVVERPSAEYRRGRIQVRIAGIFDRAADHYPLYVCADTRMQVAEGIIRVPNVAVFVDEEPKEAIPTKPPLLVVEVLSAEELAGELLDKLEDYAAWGVRHIWVARPESEKIYIYRPPAPLVEVNDFELPDYDLRIDPEQLF